MINKTVKSILLAFVLTPYLLHAQEEKKEKEKIEKDGWAAHLGAGFIYGGNIGLLIENQILLSGKLRLSPFASAGVAEGGTDSLNNKYYWFGYAAGANIEYGKAHRIIFGPHFVGQNLLGKSVEVKRDFGAGISCILGYKGTARFGLIWQIYAGAIWMQEPTYDSKKLYSNSHMGIGIGYKF